MHVQLRGDGGTPLVLLHSQVVAGRFWDPIAQELARDRLVVVPDRIGFGHSDVPPISALGRCFTDPINDAYVITTISDAIFSWLRTTKTAIAMIRMGATDAADRHRGGHHALATPVWRLGER